MKKGFLRSFCRTIKLVALRLVAGQGTKTTEEKIVFRKNCTGIFYFHLKHLLHTTQELSVLLVTDTVIHSLEITKNPKLLKTALAYILNLKTLACRARNIIRGIHASLSSACATNFPAVCFLFRGGWTAVT